MCNEEHIATWVLCQWPGLDGKTSTLAQAKVARDGVKDCNTNAGGSKQDEYANKANQAHVKLSSIGAKGDEKAPRTLGYCTSEVIGNHNRVSSWSMRTEW